MKTVSAARESIINHRAQDGFLKSTHTLRAQKFLPKRIISRNTAPPVPFLAPIRSATAGRALTRRPFVDRVGNRRVTDDFTTAVATLSFGGRDRRSVVANGAKANDALFAVCRVLRPSQGRLSGFTTEKF